MAYQLTDTQLAHLKSTSQKFELYCAFVNAFTLTATSVHPQSFQVQEQFDWRPVVRLGSNRVSVRGEPLRFYGGDSYVRGGGAASGHLWDFGDGTSGSGASVDHAYSSAGLYKVSLTVSDGAKTNTGYRWVRVYDDWSKAYDGVAEVKSLGASLSQGGWQCELRVTGDVAGIADRMGVILYAKDYWQVGRDGRGIPDTVGIAPDRYDPGIVMTGYVIGDTLRADSETHDVTFQIQTSQYFLQNSSMYAMDFWKTGKSGYGHFIDNLTMADALQHVLVEHTNFAAWHDLVLWQNDNRMECVTLNEGSLWNWVQDMAKNEFGHAYCDKRSSLYIVPNINVRGLEWWGSQDPPVMDFNAENTLQIEISEAPANRVGFVELNASRTEGGQRALTAKYPNEPGAIGSWEIVKELMCDNQTVLDALARRYYAWKNARYTARLVTGLNHALDLENIVTITFESDQ